MNEGKYGELQPKLKEAVWVPPSLHEKLERINEKINSEDEQEKALARVEKANLERKKTEKGFAEELRKTPKGSFYERLKRIRNALILAGLINLYPEGKALAPQPSPEIKALESISSIEEINNDPVMYGRALEYFKEKGGVPLSPDLPETIWRDDRYHEIAENEALESKEPFYNRPEVILGEEFIKNNPEKTKEYLEKISTAMKSTVKIRVERSDSYSIGSGVLVRNKKGERFIITNAHVIKGAFAPTVLFINKKMGIGEVMVKDEKKDIALLRINGEKLKDDSISMDTGKLYEGADVLELEENPDEVKNNDTIASIGHPLGFPFAVGISRVIRFPGYGNIFYAKDKRFSALELYSNEGHLEAESKGEAIPGMSGGPVIKLDGEGKPKLVGINMDILQYRKGNTIDKKVSEIIGVPNIFKKIRELGYEREDTIANIATSKDIIEFLKKHNLYE